jgi:hypothetical protein
LERRPAFFVAFLRVAFFFAGFRAAFFLVAFFRAVFFLVVLFFAAFGFFRAGLRGGGFGFSASAGAGSGVDQISRSGSGSGGGRTGGVSGIGSHMPGPPIPVPLASYMAISVPSGERHWAGAGIDCVSVEAMRKSASRRIATSAQPPPSPVVRHPLQPERALTTYLK